MCDSGRIEGEARKRLVRFFESREFALAESAEETARLALAALGGVGPAATDEPKPLHERDVHFRMPGGAVQQPSVTDGAEDVEALADRLIGVRVGPEGFGPGDSERRAGAGKGPASEVGAKAPAGVVRQIRSDGIPRAHCAPTGDQTPSVDRLAFRLQDALLQSGGMDDTEAAEFLTKACEQALAELQPWGAA